MIEVKTFYLDKKSCICILTSKYLNNNKQKIMLFLQKLVAYQIKKFVLKLPSEKKLYKKMVKQKQLYLIEQ